MLDGIQDGSLHHVSVAGHTDPWCSSYDLPWPHELVLAAQVRESAARVGRIADPGEGVLILLRRIAGLSVALTAAVSLAACGQAVSASTPAAAPARTPAPTTAPQKPAPHHLGPSSRLDAIKAKGTISVCTTGDYRPFTYLDPKTKRYTGIDVTMVQDLAKGLGVTVRWVPTTWKTLMDDTITKCDLAAGGISINTDRAQRAFFTLPIIEEGKTPITLCKNVAKYDTIAKINRPGVRSITPIGGTNEKFADATYPKGTIIRWKDNNTIFDEIIAGRADVMTTDASETVWVAKEKPQLCAVHPTKPFDYFGKAYLLPRGDIVFKEYVDTWLTMAKKGGTWDAATKPWFGATKLS